MKDTAELPEMPAEGIRNLHRGLTAAQVEERIADGRVNEQPDSLTPSVPDILRKNILTLFNLINVVLAVIIATVGHIENTIFLGIAVCNTAMGIFQELKAKRTLDKLAILAQSDVIAMRDGVEVTLHQEQVVLDDLLVIHTGNQICADGIVVESFGLETDESLLTGEPDNIKKEENDTVMSGSYVTGGSALIQVTAVGSDSYATGLTIEAKAHKKQNSQLMRMLNMIIRVLTFVIIPLGALLFYKSYSNGAEIADSVLSASAAMLGMIPEGLILLTGVTLTVGAMTLSRHKALVQSLPSIETLARTDVLCLDKTGTITDGTLTYETIELFDGFTQAQANQAIAALMGALPDSNATAEALRRKFGDQIPWAVTEITPFSSERKWSGASFEGAGSFILGAPGFVFPGRVPHQDLISEYAREGHRTLCLAYSNQKMEQGVLPQSIEFKALLVLSDTVREEAPETFRYLIEEGMTLKVISGDDPVTVSTIAQKAGLPSADKFINMSEISPDTDFRKITDDFTVFGRVSPAQKKQLIHALKQNGHTTCMTGDGVNDVPAMKEADCSIAMVNGSDAARNSCDFVLMASDFRSMVNILKEGRRVINNIETVSSLYLVKTIYSTLLTLLFIFLPFSYPFAPLQMTPINVFTVGIPSFILALRANYERPDHHFLSNILENSLPAAIITVINILLVQLAGLWFGLSPAEISTMSVLLTAAVGFVLLLEVGKPLTILIKVMLVSLVLGFLALFVFFGEFFMLSSLFTRNVLFYLPLLYAAPHMFRELQKLIQKICQIEIRIGFKKKNSEVESNAHAAPD